MRRWRRLWPLLLPFAAPAMAVGLGPLAVAGRIDGPREAFYLDLYNPYPAAAAFRLYPIGPADEVAQARVDILPGEAVLGAGRSRRILVIADALAVGETYSFRVCAERRDPLPGMNINARVCSRLTAHRIL